MTDPNKITGTGTVTAAPLAVRSQTSGFNLMFELWNNAVGSEELRLGAVNFAVDCGPDFRNFRAVLYSLYHLGKLNLIVSEISTPYSIVLGRFDKVDFKEPKSALTQHMPKGALVVRGDMLFYVVETFTLASTYGVVIGNIVGGEDLLLKISNDRTQKVGYTLKCTACTDSKRL